MFSLLPGRVQRWYSWVTRTAIYPKNSLDDSLNDKSRNIRNLYELNSLQQIVNEPTRITLSASMLIDHIPTTCIGNVLEARVYRIALGDHILVICTRELNIVNTEGPKMIRTRNMRKFNEEAFLADVAKKSCRKVF